MQRIAFYAQNEDTDADGFYTNSHEAERTALQALGAPDTDTMRIDSITAEDRDEAIVEAEVSDALADWIRSSLSVID